MSGLAELRASAAFQELLEVSERLGRDPLQVQGPGGNTSIKSGGVMLVKASGTWLAEARERDIMAPVRVEALRMALAEDDPAAEQPQNFLVEEENGSGLRPSIETTLHAALEWPVVLHTHCVATIAVAARADAEEVVAAKLGDLGAVVVPYVKPGVELAREIMARATPDTRVIVLGNHGLVVGADSPAEGEALIATVESRLGRPPSEGAPPTSGLSELAERIGWRLAPNPATHAIALDPVRLALASGASLYPDHVIFLGPGVCVAQPGEAIEAVAARAAGEGPDGGADGGPARKLILIPGEGALL
nr:class II aldolase/adducin family protein [Paracoccaceae bacterium]